ncbi:MAG: hypothetical protein OXI43_07150 [Candidatus Poribacteria bacterium]|nr:hypothetical protein [Candidatus Poribacteria bacterium]
MPYAHSANGIHTVDLAYLPRAFGVDLVCRKHAYGQVCNLPIKTIKNSYEWIGFNQPN